MIDVTLLLFLLMLALPAPAHAVCPICTLAVAGGLGLSRWLGIDDTITGIWIGGLIISSALWLADWIKRKSWKVPYPEVLSIILMILLVIPPLYWSDLIGLPGNTFWGVDKVILGTLIGSLLFMVGVWLDKYLRTTNEGKVYVYYQKVIAPVFLLTLGSFAFYLITK